MSKAAELLNTPGALLTRSHLRELGLERRAVDAVFKALPVVVLPGYSRPLIRVAQYLELVERSTYAGDRVRPCNQPPAMGCWPRGDYGSTPSVWPATMRPALWP